MSVGKVKLLVSGVVGLSLVHGAWSMEGCLRGCLGESDPQTRGARPRQTAPVPVPLQDQCENPTCQFAAVPQYEDKYCSEHCKCGDSVDGRGDRIPSPLPPAGRLSETTHFSHMRNPPVSPAHVTPSSSSPSFGNQGLTTPRASRDASHWPRPAPPSDLGSTAGSWDRKTQTERQSSSGWH